MGSFQWCGGFVVGVSIGSVVGARVVEVVQLVEGEGVHGFSVVWERSKGCFGLDFGFLLLFDRGSGRAGL